MKHVFSIFFIVLLVLTSCAGNAGKADSEGETISLKYAHFLTLSEGEGYISAVITNPWDTTKVLHRYVLVPKSATALPENLPEGDIIRTPLSHSVVNTSVHCNLIDQLGAYRSIVGVCDAEYIYLPKIAEDIKQGSIKDLGNSMTPNLEKLIDLSPDAILLSPFENSGTYGKLGKLKIPLVECADYMETSALGRAEWMRFFGILFGREHEADSIFAAVEQEYNALKAKVADAKDKPTLLADMKTGSTWYVAGANSTMGMLYSDAGAEYIFHDEPSSGAVPYDPEVVFDRGQNADFWLVKYNQATDKTLDELKRDWPNNASIAAFTKKQVFGCNLSTSMFYEETPFHPELLLKELISVFHPEVLPGYSRRYFKPLH